MILTTMIAIRKYAKELVNLNDTYRQEELWEFLIDKGHSIRTIKYNNITFDIMERDDIVILSCIINGYEIKDCYYHNDYISLIRELDKILKLSCDIDDNDSDNIKYIKDKFNKANMKISEMYKRKSSKLPLIELINNIDYCNNAKMEIYNILGIA